MLRSAVSPGDQSRKSGRSDPRRCAFGRPPLVSLLYRPQSQDHLQKSSARLNLKLNMDKRARSRSQMMISSKCTKQTRDTHTRLLSPGSSEWTGLDRGTACIEAANRIKQQRSEVVENKKDLSHSVNPHVISRYTRQNLMWQNKKKHVFLLHTSFSPPRIKLTLVAFV